MKLSWFSKRFSTSAVLLVNMLIRLGRLAVLAITLVAIYFAYRYSLHNLVHGSFALGFLVLWVLIAYVTLPRLHRWLTKIYLPDYYMNRSRTGEGLLGDPINIAVYGSAKQLREAMHSIGWVESDRPTLKNTLHIIYATLFAKSYPSAPGSMQYLFGRRQDYSFQLEQFGNPRNRRHVRFWKTPEGWWLPGGYTADWIGAVHYDTHIGLSLFTGQFLHKISRDIDEERDLLVADLVKAGVVKHVETVAHFSSGFHGRGGGGDHIRTDGAMPFVRLQEPPKRRKKQR